MTNFLPTRSKISIGLAFTVLSLSVLACASVVPSPVITPTAPFTDMSSLPTADPSSGSTDTLPPVTPDANAPTLGEDIPIAGADHIEVDTVATDWNSNPPTSGQHYGQWAPAGFYDDEIPDGYLVHDMEHGYIIIYYNCADVDMDCEEFKTAIEAAMATAGNDPNTNTVKIIAVPRPSMENPITYASWGHLYKAEAFVSTELVTYVQTYRSNAAYAPEASLP